MRSNSNNDSPKEVARQQLALAVETLSNIHYLIEHCCDNPDSVKKFVEMAEPAMDVLRKLARRREPKSPVESTNFRERQAHLPGEPAADRTDLLPLAAAGEENPPSQDDVSPGSRIEEP
jgi:hypothetical protein